MRFAVLVKATKRSEAGDMPSPELLAKMGAFNDELIKAGALLAGEGLHPSKRGKRLSFGGARPTATDGPFAETKELVAGFWLVQARSMDEAVAWFSRCPFEDGEQIEIRPVYDAEDFAYAADGPQAPGAAQ